MSGVWNYNPDANQDGIGDGLTSLYVSGATVSTTDWATTDVVIDISGSSWRINGVVLTGSPGGGSTPTDTTWDYLYIDNTSATTGTINFVGGDQTDTVIATANNDTLSGGAGSDTLYGYTGDDSIIGGTGNDSLVGVNGNDSLFGGDGDDTLKGGGDDDWLFGGDGNDTLSGGTGTNTIDGGDGNDLIVLNSSSINNVTGGLGNDTVSAGNGNDTIDGGAGDDSILGQGGNDSILGGDGSDTINGGSADDILYGGAGDDVLSGGVGSDILSGEDGNDSLLGSLGNDSIYGGLGNDYLNGGTDNDVLWGGDGNDVLLGGPGNDILYGESGDDTLSGGSGLDSLTGGDGNDTFTDSATDFNGDTITDFAMGDSIIVMGANLSSLNNSVASNTLNLGSGNTLNLLGITSSSGSFSAVYDSVSGNTTITLVETKQDTTNYAPVITSNGGVDNPSITVSENGTYVTTVKATDANNLTYSLTSGADRSLFTINSTTGELSFKTAPDFESPTDANKNNVYIVQVTVTDDGEGALKDVQTFAITVSDVDDTTTQVNTTDGVNVTTVTNSNGSQTTTVPIVSSTREDDTQTQNRNLADIVLAEDDDGGALLSVSLPTGAGLTSQGPSNTQTITVASGTLISSISTHASDDLEDELIASAQSYLDSLDEGTQVLVRTITPELSSDISADDTILISGTTGRQEALVIDVSSLPQGTKLKLDDIDFVTIVGDADARGGLGANIVTADDGSQFIVLGEDDDELHAGGGSDTIGSLGGNDLVDGGAGNDTVFGGAGQDTLAGGEGSDELNGGFGFDTAELIGNRDDYNISVEQDHIVLTHKTNGETTSIVDVELLEFDDSQLYVAGNEAEAIGQYLVSTWLGRNLTAEEVAILQSEAWQNTSTSNLDIVDTFRSVSGSSSLNSMSDDELLAGFSDSEDILITSSNRFLNGSDLDEQRYLNFGLGLEVDGGAGFDVMQYAGSQDDLAIEEVDGLLQITQYQDGSMINLSNVEMIAFDDGDNLMVAQTPEETVLGGLFTIFLGRSASLEEWSIGTELLEAGETHHEAILKWFEDQAGLNAQSDTQDTISTFYQNISGRDPTALELAGYESRLDEGSTSYGWIGVEIALTDEAAENFANLVSLYDWV